jgi:carbamoyl-phosphate synthase large subunit
MNIQFAVKDGQVYMLEVNPRASRTVPFVSKAIGVPLAKIAAKCMIGHKLRDLGFTREITPPFWSVKESVFPFSRFRGTAVVLSPEMRSTGEVMGIDADLGLAYAKAQMAAQPALPTSGTAFLSVKESDKAGAVQVARELAELGFVIHSTSGTADALSAAGIAVTRVGKISEGARPNVLDLLKNGKIQVIVNTAAGMLPRQDENLMRAEAVLRGVYMASTLNAAKAAAQAIRSLRARPIEVLSLQERLKTLPKSV